MTSKKSITETLASLLIFLFLYTSISKYLEFSKFNRVLAKTPLLNAFPELIAFGLPALEILIAILLIVPRTRLIGFYASFIIMILFTGYLIYMINFTPDLPCSCGGVLQSLTWKQHIYFNSGFVIIAGLGSYLQRKLDKGLHETVASAALS